MTDTTTPPADAGTSADQPQSLRDCLDSQTTGPATVTPAPSTGRIIDAAHEGNHPSKTDARKHEMIYAGDNLAKNASAILSDLMFLTLDTGAITQDEFRQRVEKTTIKLARTLERYSGNRREFVALDRDGTLDPHMFEVTKQEADRDRADDSQRELIASGLSISTLQRDIDELYDEAGVSRLPFDDTAWRLIHRE